MGSLILLSSYPKSGNTWLRAVVASLARGGQSIDINQNPAGTLRGADRHLFEQVTGKPSCGLSDGEVAQARCVVWQTVASSVDEPLWVKSHDAFMPIALGAPPPYPAACMEAVLYVVRDPRDVAVSFSHHFNVSLDEAIEYMADPTATLDREPSSPLLPQLLSTWSRHVTSWMDTPELPVHVIRYEDMHASPLNSFGQALRRVGLAFDEPTLARAIDACGFQALQAQERQAGFRERESHAALFFRSGAVGGWREVLSESQVRRITHEHGPTMARLGYR